MDEDYCQDSNCHFEEIKAILRVTRNEVTNELVKMNSRLIRIHVYVRRHIR